MQADGDMNDGEHSSAPKRIKITDGTAENATSTENASDTPAVIISPPTLENIGTLPQRQKLRRGIRRGPRTHVSRASSASTSVTSSGSFDNEKLRGEITQKLDTLDAPSTSTASGTGAQLSPSAPSPPSRKSEGTTGTVSEDAAVSSPLEPAVNTSKAVTTSCDASIQAKSMATTTEAISSKATIQVSPSSASTSEGTVTVSTEDTEFDPYAAIDEFVDLPINGAGFEVIGDLSDAELRKTRAKVSVRRRIIKRELDEEGNPIIKPRGPRGPRKPRKVQAPLNPYGALDEYALPSDTETVILSPRRKARNGKTLGIKPTTCVKKERKEAAFPKRKRNDLLEGCNQEFCSNIGEKYIDATDEVAPPGWRCGWHIPGLPCSALGCTEYGRAKKPNGYFYCRTHLQQCVIMGCTHVGRLKIPADALGESGWRCKMHGGGHKCNVESCHDSGQVKATADRLGPAGYRCDVHGRICSVVGCKNMGLLRRVEDKFGPAGRRCTSHGGADQCNVIMCMSNAKMNIKVPDSNGPAGPRCDRHSRMCTATGCHKVGQRRRQDDFRGPAGYRCLRHGGGHECNVDNCNCIGQVKKREPDHFGPAGYRCNQHGQFCVVPGCGRGGRCKRGADETGPAGYRCRAHLPD